VSHFYKIPFYLLPALIFLPAILGVYFIRGQRALVIAFPILLCVGCLFPIHMTFGAATPAWIVILCSLALSSLIFWACTRWLSRNEKPIAPLLYVFSVIFCLVMPWRFFWSAGEELLMFYGKKSGPMDSYYYGGLSGRGFADGFSHPAETFGQFAALALAIAALSLIQHRLVYRPK
jgi:hypothetical protein